MDGPLARERLVGLMRNGGRRAHNLCAEVTRLDDRSMTAFAQQPRRRRTDGDASRGGSAGASSGPSMRRAEFRLDAGRLAIIYVAACYQKQLTFVR